MPASDPTATPFGRALDGLLPDTFVWLDQSGVVVHVSGVDHGAFAGPVASIVGRAVGELPPSVSVPLDRAMQHLGVHGPVETFEFTRTESDGLHAWEGRLVADGPYRLLVIRSRTARRRVEMANAAQRERLAVTLRSIGDGVIATDRESRVVLMNPAAAALLGVAPEAARGRPLGEVLPDDHLDSWGAVRPHAEVRGPDGTVRRLQLSMAPVLQHGQMLGAVYALRDVTREQRAEEERLRASKLESVGLLAGGIAHDFNNLLAAIQGNLSVARSILPEVPGEVANELAEILVDVDAASRRATALTRQLLTFSSGGAPMLAVTAIEDVVRDAVDFGMRGSNVRHAYTIAEDLPAVEVDPDQIAQVLQNLVINACQAMPGGGSLEVEVGAPDRLPSELGGHYGPWVRVTVRDEGLGIPEADLGRIFDPYFTTKPAGTGLGLASAYSIVRKHKGFVAVTSEVGVGTTFGVYLPAVNGVVAVAPMPEDPSLQRFPGRLLVVDDEPAVRVLAKRMFASLGLEVVVAPDGEAGIALYADAVQAGHRFDAVLLDLTIPGGMGGQEAVKELLALDSDAVCVATSGYFNDPVLAHYQDYGFRGRLAKPYDRDAAATMLTSVWTGVVGTPLPAAVRR